MKIENKFSNIYENMMNEAKVGEDEIKRAITVLEKIIKLKTMDSQ